MTYTDDELRLDGGEWEWKNGLATWVPHPPPPPPEPNRCKCGVEIGEKSTHCLHCSPGAPRQPINHGTYGGYMSHARHGIPLCDDCRKAGSDYNRARRQARKKAA